MKKSSPHLSNSSFVVVVEYPNQSTDAFFYDHYADAQKSAEEKTMQLNPKCKVFIAKLTDRVMLALSTRPIHSLGTSTPRVTPVDQTEPF